MKPLKVGLVADPATPTQVAYGFEDLHANDDGRRAWDVEVLSEPFTLAREDVDTVLSRLTAHGREHQ